MKQTKDLILHLGVKSDPVEYRYSYEWLFALLRRHGINRVQLGSFFELYSLPDDYFVRLRDLAGKYEVRIQSCFTAHRELGGFFIADTAFEAVARRNYERFIAVASLLGADYVGSNPGAVFRDRMSCKQDGIACYLRHMKELMNFAKSKGLKGLTMEPMSCSAEPPTFPEEIEEMLYELNTYHQQHDDTVPVYVCGDISHGFADIRGKVVYDNYRLFEQYIPYMCEFHFKNTDKIFNATFGFSPDEEKRGIVDLEKLKSLIVDHAASWPAREVTGYLEIGGPKLGRDYSDYQLEAQLEASITRLQKVFGL